MNEENQVNAPFEISSKKMKSITAYMKQQQKDADYESKNRVKLESMGNGYAKIHGLVNRAIEIQKNKINK